MTAGGALHRRPARAIVRRLIPGSGGAAHWREIRGRHHHGQPVGLAPRCARRRPFSTMGVPYEAPPSSRPTAPPDRLWDYGRTAATRGLKAIIAGAGGAAHLPRMMASEGRACGDRRAGATRAPVGRRFPLIPSCRCPRRLPGRDHGPSARRGLRICRAMAAAILCPVGRGPRPRLDAWRAALIGLDPRDSPSMTERWPPESA